MQKLKNSGVGFVVSFLGSIPLGYLNVIGFHVFQQKGMLPTVWFVLGVICVESVVIYGTLVFAKRLAANIRLTKYIEGFSVLFMQVLAAVFYFSSHSKSNGATTIQYLPFVLGILSSGLNFIQIPFWTGWNLYLLNGHYIEVSKSRIYFYVIGTNIGTFCGMMTLIVSLHFFASNVDFLSKYLLKYIIPSIFLGLGIFQGVKFWRKYRS
jgi:hypothetical protein